MSENLVWYDFNNDKIVVLKNISRAYFYSPMLGMAVQLNDGAVLCLIGDL
jgi:hypothetical protein